ncbi:TPA: O-antigen polymerase [Escherichia coli]
MLFTCVWVPIIFISALNYLGADNYHEKLIVFYINLVFVVSYYLGVILAFLGKPYNNRLNLNSDFNERKAKCILYFLTVLCLCGFLIGIQKWQAVGISILSFTSDTYYEMNVLHSESDGILSGISGRLYVLSYVLILYTLFLYKINIIHKRELTIYIAMALLFLFSPRRAIIIYSIISLLVYLLFFARIKLLKKIGLLLSVSLSFIILFGFTQYSLGKMDNFEMVNIFESFFHYYYSSIPVMDSLISTNHFVDEYILLSTPLRFISALIQVPINIDLSIPFVNIPEPSNTLPITYYLYRSSGFVAIITFSIIFGFMSVRMERGMDFNCSFQVFAFNMLLSVGTLMSVREMFFITYDFFFWCIVIFIISYILRFKARI